jgi:hypothetical protein
LSIDDVTSQVSRSYETAFSRGAVAGVLWRSPPGTEQVCQVRQRSATFRGGDSFSYWRVALSARCGLGATGRTAATRQSA